MRRYSVRRVVFALSALAVVILAISSSYGADDPKYTIKEVMNQAHGGMQNSLYAKVLTGKASQEEKDQLVDLYSALPDNKPNKGSAQSWKTKTTALLDAAKAVAENKNNSINKLKSANNCMSCHSSHRGR